MKKNLKVLNLALGLVVVSLFFYGYGNLKETTPIEEKGNVAEQEAVV